MQQHHSDIEKLINQAGRSTAKKILFACVPGDGHFNPLTGIAMHLKSLGYDVRWYSSVAYQEKLQKLRIPMYPFTRALDVTGATVDEIFPERNSIYKPIDKLNFDFQHFFLLRSSEYYADILELYNDFPFDMMISDCMFTAIPFVKEKMNIPVISIGVLPLFETSKDLAPAGLALTPATNVLGSMKHAFLRFFSERVLFKKSFDLFRTILNAHGINTGNSSGFDILVKKATLLLQSGTPGFEYKRTDLGKNIRFIGPLLPYSSKISKTTWYDNRLLRYDKVIIVTQGTVEKNPEKIIVPVLEAYKDTNTLVVATTGGSQTQQLKKRYPQENIIIEDFIPFDDIMPYADVYVTNGGYGGVMLGIENQLPLVVAGVHEGKNEINARIGYFKLGVNMKTETPGPALVKRSVDEVLHDDRFKKNVIALANEFKTYDTYHLVTKHIKEILTPSDTNMHVAFKQVNNN